MRRLAEISVDRIDTGIGYRVRCYEDEDLVISRVYQFLETAQDIKVRWEYGCTVDELD